MHKVIIIYYERLYFVFRDKMAGYTQIVFCKTAYYKTRPSKIASRKCVIRLRTTVDYNFRNTHVRLLK